MNAIAGGIAANAVQVPYLRGGICLRSEFPTPGCRTAVPSP